MPANKAIPKEMLPLVDRPILQKTPLGVGDEIQLTDAIAMLMDNQTVEAICMTGKSYDCGYKIGHIKANVEYAMRNRAFGDQFKSHLRALLDNEDNSSNI